MPCTYEQDGKGDDAVAYLHYFAGRSDWYITEKDMGYVQGQAFGLADIREPELGYISNEELMVSPYVKLDLRFEPTTLKVIKERYEV